MDYNVVPSKHVLKYLKKLKDKKLKKKFLDVIYDDIAQDPYAGEQKRGDLSGFWSVGFTYAKADYRVAYTIEDDMVIPVVLIGSHENFYKTLKNKK